MGASGGPGGALRHLEGFQVIKGQIFLEPQIGQALDTPGRKTDVILSPLE